MSAAELTARAAEAEALARIVSYAPDKVRLREQAADYRAEAARRRG